MKTEIKDTVYKAAIDAMNAGEYVTMIAYIHVPSGKDYVGGQTFKNCHLQSCWNGKNIVK